MKVTNELKAILFKVSIKYSLEVRKISLFSVNALHFIVFGETFQKSLDSIRINCCLDCMLVMRCIFHFGLSEKFWPSSASFRGPETNVDWLKVRIINWMFED
jgi:hypothetical protein